jgi:DNA-binding LacI/PurR family transcriptional regulator
VGLDCTAAGRLAADYLRKKGYQSLGYIQGKNDPHFIRELLDGFTQAAGPVLDDHVYTSGLTWNMGTELADRMLENKESLPDAVFVPEESTAAGMMTRFKETGLTLPDDIAVIAFGDCIEPRRYAPLTTIHQPAGEKGKKAAEMLIGMINNNHTEHRNGFHCFKPELVPGATA